MKPKLCRLHNVLRDAENSCYKCVDANQAWKNAKYPKNPETRFFGRPNAYERRWSSGQPDAEERRKFHREMVEATVRRRGR